MEIATAQPFVLAAVPLALALLLHWRLRRAQEIQREFRWLGLMGLAVLWFLVLSSALRLAGAPFGAGDLLRGLANFQFAVGSLNIAPGRIVLGVMLFIALAAALRSLRTRLETHLLGRLPLDRPTRESLATVLGYIGFAISVLFGLGIAGVELSHIALIAGALSVGIGFGLQNIVNNFVSGLILLWERPVRIGDYIRVGSIEGVVRRISIRSTEIETYDRISIIVPNSDLISGTVENWMLRDRYGRISVSVGVAYGSDTRKVASILKEVAGRHPDTVDEGEVPNVPGPLVQFSDFGDSALSFVVKVYIRDVDRRFSIASEVRFDIDAAFREAGITIPFPQRDLWVKALPDSA